VYGKFRSRGLRERAGLWRQLPLGYVMMSPMADRGAVGLAGSILDGVVLLISRDRRRPPDL